MATRFYFQPFGLRTFYDPVAYPAYSTYWNNTAVTHSGKMTRTPEGDAEYQTDTSTFASDKTTSTNPYNILLGRFLSDALPSGTIPTGTVFRLVLPFYSQSPNATNSMLSVVVRLFSSAGVQKSVIYAGPSGTSVVSSGVTANNRTLINSAANITTRRYTDITTGAASIDAGDRIQVEFGVRHVNTTTNANTVKFYFSAAETAWGDLPFKHDYIVRNNVGPSAWRQFRGWFEFDTNLGQQGLFTGMAKYGEAGYLLGASTSTLPFVDIESIDGVDAAPLQVSQANRQGGHGGYVNSQWEAPRTITIQGTLYADSVALDQELNKLRYSFRPTRVDKPLYVGTDEGRRIFYGRPQGFRYVIDKSSGYGVVRFQVQIICGDPRRYSDLHTIVPITSNATQYIDILGDRDTPGLLRIRHIGTISGMPFSWNIFNSEGYLSVGTGVGGAPGLNPGEELEINMDQRTITRDAEFNARGEVTVSYWGLLAPGINAVTAGGSMAQLAHTIEYRPAWW